MPRFHMPTPNTSWEESSTQESHGSPPRPTASGEGTTKQQQPPPLQRDQTSSSSSGPQGQKTTSTAANIVSPPKAQQEEHDTSKVAKQEDAGADEGRGDDEMNEEGTQAFNITVSKSSSRDDAEKSTSSPSHSSSRADAGRDFSSSNMLSWPPGQSGGRYKGAYPPYRQPGRQYKLPPSSPVRRVDDDDHGDDKAARMTSPTASVPYRSGAAPPPYASKPSPTISRSFSSDRGDRGMPPHQSAYGAVGVPPHSPVRSSGHYPRDAPAPNAPTPTTPQTPSRHDVPYEGPYIDTAHSGSWGYSAEYGPPPSGGPGYPQTPTNSFPAPGEEGHSSYYSSPGPGYVPPPVGPSASYDSAYATTGYDYDGYHHPRVPYPIPSRDEDDPGNLLRDYDPNQDSHLHPSASYDMHGSPNTNVILTKKNRKAAKTTAPIDPNDPTITTGVSILTGNTRVAPPDSAKEVDFDIHKPPMKPYTKESSRPLCNSISDLNMHDVLLGRGGGTNTQEGNRRFRTLVTDFQPTYLMAKRKEKPLLARSIVLIIRKRGGRFLKKDDHTGRLHEVGDEKAEAKTSQALREGLDVRATKSAANALLKQEKEAKKRIRKAAAAARRSGKQRHDKDAYYSSPGYGSEGPPTSYYHSPYSHSHSPGGYYPPPPNSPYAHGVPSSSSFDREDRGTKRGRDYYEQQSPYQSYEQQSPYQGYEQQPPYQGYDQQVQQCVQHVE